MSVDASEIKLVPVRTFQFLHEAMVDKAKLESAGIDCFIKNDNMEVIQPFFSQISDGIKLMVRESDLEIANAIIEDKEEKEEQ